MIVFLMLLFIEKSTATTFYINDNNTKGDIYTTAIGNNNNEGTSSGSPKLSIKAVYQNAQDGDTIIIDTGNYIELSPKGELLFPATKKITFIIAGITNTLFSKTPLPSNTKTTPADFYIEKDQPIDREAYLQKMRNGEIKKPQ